MNFKKFNKNKEIKRMFIIMILGIFLLIEVLTLYRTFAFYEERKEFNVLRGRVPEFSQKDVWFAFTVDGVKSDDTFPIDGSLYAGINTTCENGATGIWNNGSWSLSNINSNGNKKVKCTVDFQTRENINIYDNANIGDYVIYTPMLTNYEVSKESTGSDKIQSINPSELNLWRVINKNADGTVELVSEYTSSNGINFMNKIGYKNLVGSLNKIANSYETIGITSGSRCTGYNGQVEYITDDTKLDSTSRPFDSNSYNDETLKSVGTEIELLGGGDQLYYKDLDLINAACGILKTTKVGSEDLSSYWLASRVYAWPNVETWFFDGLVYDSELERTRFNYHIYYYQNGQFSSYGSKYVNYIRPIVILKSGLTSISGNGSIDTPWRVN